MSPEDCLTDHYREGYASAVRDHEDGADPAAMLLIADALREMRGDGADREAYHRGRVDYLRGALHAG